MMYVGLVSDMCQESICKLFSESIAAAADDDDDLSPLI